MRLLVSREKDPEQHGAPNSGLPEDIETEDADHSKCRRIGRFGFHPGAKAHAHCRGFREFTLAGVGWHAGRFGVSEACVVVTKACRVVSLKTNFAHPF